MLTRSQVASSAVLGLRPSRSSWLLSSRLFLLDRRELVGGMALSGPQLGLADLGAPALSFALGEALAGRLAVCLMEYDTLSPQLMLQLISLILSHGLEWRLCLCGPGDFTVPSSASFSPPRSLVTHVLPHPPLSPGLEHLKSFDGSIEQALKLADRLVPRVDRGEFYRNVEVTLLASLLLVHPGIDAASLARILAQPPEQLRDFLLAQDHVTMGLAGSLAHFSAPSLSGVAMSLSHRLSNTQTSLVRPDLSEALGPGQVLVVLTTPDLYSLMPLWEMLRNYSGELSLCSAGSISFPRSFSGHVYLRLGASARSGRCEKYFTWRPSSPGVYYAVSRGFTLLDEDGLSLLASPSATFPWFPQRKKR